MSNVTHLRDGRPTLNDIPNSLRSLAAAYDDVPGDIPRTFVWIEYNEDGSLDLGCFGDCPTNKAQVVGILALAQRHFDHESGDLHRGECAVGELSPVIQLRGNAMKMQDDPTEGGIPASSPSPAPAPTPERKASKSWIGYVVGALVIGVLIYLATR